MESYVNVFLKTELTIIPRLLDKYMGKYYNNALCNGITWMFVLWCLIHVCFHKLLNALLKKMRYKEYVRIRLEQALWYLGFYSTAGVYCTATLLRNNLKIIKVDRQFNVSSSPSGHFVLGFIVLVAFYLHSACWEKLKEQRVVHASKYLCLSVFIITSYFLKLIEGAFRLTIIICCTQVVLEVARCGAILINREVYKNKFVVGALFALSTLIFFIDNCLIIPMLFLYPLFERFNSALSILLLLLVTWLVLELYDCVLAKLIHHFLYHNQKNCELNTLECSLFQPRNDATYNLLVFRKEMKQREEECLLLRKPKKNNMVFQTLKCMVAIKRKLNEKRRLMKGVESSDDEGDEISANENAGADENKTTIVGGKLAFNINKKAEEATSLDKRKKD